jgi:hypothetical protein
LKSIINDYHPKNPWIEEQLELNRGKEMIKMKYKIMKQSSVIKRENQQKWNTDL